MKKIGEGYYYDVFERDSRTVVKRIKNKITIFLFILCANGLNVRNALREYGRVIRSIPNLKNEYAKILDLIADRTIIGNPRFINDTDYIQDKTVGLKNINELGEEDFDTVICDYVDLLKHLWTYEISDSTFNFSINCGYNKDHELILFDFNEMTYNRDAVRDQIKNKRWLKKASYLGLTKEKQKRSNEIFNREVTGENLERYWGSSNPTFSADHGVTVDGVEVAVFEDGSAL
jgi:hypothetical protein